MRQNAFAAGAPPWNPLGELPDLAVFGGRSGKRKGREGERNEGEEGKGKGREGRSTHPPNKNSGYGLTTKLKCVAC